MDEICNLYASYAENLMVYNFFPPRKVVHHDLKRLAFLTVGPIFNWKGAIESGDARRHNGGRNSIQLHLVRFLERSEVTL